MSAPPLTEAIWESRVTDYARTRRWLTFHTPRVQIRPGRFITPAMGSKGFLDWVFAREGRILVVELKVEGKYPTAHQRIWLKALGDYGRVWRPADWPEVQETLA